MNRNPPASPRIGIGVPVFNAEKYLAQALDSLLGQTFGDFEIAITDNASTDGTERIAREYAARDERVVYHRNPSNLGAAPNFNRSFELARGEYFKWAAGDDLCAPTFLERCVERLDGDAGTVLAYSRVAMIDAEGTPNGAYEVKLETDSRNPVRRFQVLLRGHHCYEVFGLIRRSALERTGLIGSYSHGDGVMLARLALLGRFEEISEPLFFTRKHEEQSMAWQRDRRRNAVWFDSRLAGKRLYPYWRMGYEFVRAVRGGPLDPWQKLRCYRLVWRWAYQRRRQLREDVAFHLRSRFRGSAQRAS